MSVAALRPQVLSVYKRILRLGRTWEAKSGDSEVTKIEREYIKKEAGILFRKNKHLTDEQEIRDCIREAEARVEMALHYRNPYPRPVNVPPQALAKRKGKEQGKFQEKIKEQSKPIYIKSVE